MLGHLYERALDGERCWVRHEDGVVRTLPVCRWLGGPYADSLFDRTVIDMCRGPTIDLGCGPGRFVSALIQRGIPALGVDQSATAVGMARRNGAPVLHQDVFDPLPGTGRWRTVLLADGNVGLGGDPLRMLTRAAEMLHRGGSCVAEFEPATRGLRRRWIRLESPQTIGPWFRWASVGIDCAADLAEEAGLTLTRIHPIGERVVARLRTA
ncbi:class I SAM-dependent methyltransferase [Mycolicibacterium holsaticum]|jgi:hypothetical protein|uniref:Methyltransferase type 12 n=1 Tax=Mycolicibacterium holsaticum TaxID=152142 RepID=A0A1E3RV66_9MYCO|nr:class I SAM-dependent methyltransferase [Mycolicibacterium holsaticum]ODQ93750.1 methyltransferase type 12 [Mycolicibacterium holsaticum]